MDGWFSDAADWASRRNLAWNVGSRAMSGRSILTATSRPSRTSWPMCTSAMPPRPSRSPSRYRSPSCSGTPVVTPHPFRSSVVLVLALALAHAPAAVLVVIGVRGADDRDRHLVTTGQRPVRRHLCHRTGVAVCGDLVNLDDESQLPQLGAD